jgi:hypothetical protein
MQSITLTVLIRVVSFKRDKHLQKYDLMFDLNVKVVKKYLFMFLLYSKKKVLNFKQSYTHSYVRHI